MRFDFRNKFALIATLLCLLSALSHSNAFAESTRARIAVVLSQTAAPYQDALEGFKQYLNRQGLDAAFDVYDLNSRVSAPEQVFEKINKDGVKLIYTLGTIATDTALDKTTGLPIVAGLILKTDKLKNRNATGVTLDFPLETQFKMMRRLLPKAKTIGVLYNSAQNRQFILNASEIAKRMSFKLEAHEVRSPKDLPEALKEISRSAEAIWGINDSAVFTPETTKHILLFSYRNQIPFIGLSYEWVKAGALYSLDRDYKGIGAQCGEMAANILKGSSADSIPVASPQNIWYSLNLRAAKQMKIEFSEAVVQGAQAVY